MDVLSQTVAIGPVVISIGQILIAIAVLVALIAGGLAGRRHGVRVSDSLLTVVLVALVGARAVFVVRYWGSFDGVGAMLDIRDGGLDPWGGLVAGGAYAAWTLWRAPALRGALVRGLVAGGVTWAVTAGPLLIIDQQSRPIPDETVHTLDGERTALPELVERHEQPLVVNLWATWCPPCQREMPVLERAQAEEDDVTFVFVNQGEDGSQVTAYLEEHDLELDNVLLDPHNSLGDATGAQGVPATFYYDEEGQLVDTHSGEVSRASLEQGLERLR